MPLIPRIMVVGPSHESGPGPSPSGWPGQGRWPSWAPCAPGPPPGPGGCSRHRHGCPGPRHGDRLPPARAGVSIYCRDSNEERWEAAPTEIAPARRPAAEPSTCASSLARFTAGIGIPAVTSISTRRLVPAEADHAGRDNHDGWCPC